MTFAHKAWAYAPSCRKNPADARCRGSIALADLSQGAAVLFSGVNCRNLLDKHAIWTRRDLHGCFSFDIAWGHGKHKDRMLGHRVFILTSKSESPIFIFTLPLLYTSIFPMKPSGRSLSLEPRTFGGLVPACISLELVLVGSASTPSPLSVSRLSLAALVMEEMQASGRKATVLCLTDAVKCQYINQQNGLAFATLTGLKVKRLGCICYTEYNSICF